MLALNKRCTFVCNTMEMPDLDINTYVSYFPHEYIKLTAQSTDEGLSYCWLVIALEYPGQSIQCKITVLIARKDLWPREEYIV